MPVSRAGAKLRAALDHFGLAPAIAGASAVDVGASAGGFTEILLAEGATSVLAVDVGREQLHPSLRADARVTVREETDWKRLPLHEAEGPFDFFTVDVSFVAARNMLRGLAFRLRPGAEGVVLIKPQFELPDRQVKGGEVRDQNLRQAAVDRVRRRAEALGFELAGEIDSPVSGREGSIEILAHLRFKGRPDSLPALGERRREQTTTGRRAGAARDELRWFAVVAPGLESAVERELRALDGVKQVQTETGGVEWTAPALGGFEANLRLRVATRILARVGSVEAREFGKLRRHAAGLPWARFIPRGATVTIRASASRSRLYHTGALAENAALAIADAVPGVRLNEKKAHPETPDTDEEAAAGPTVLIRGLEDQFTFSMDASGERLHRRGARIEVGAAPMRETLAAGLLALAGWEPSQPLCDPVCGAGTIAIEAALQAIDRVPGLDREFAIEDWPLFLADETQAAATALREHWRAQIRPAAPAPIWASDRDAAAIDSAGRNAARAGVAGQIAFACRDLADARPPGEAPGLIIANPPYGRRLGDPRAAMRVYRDLGRVLRAHFRGWRAAVVVPMRLGGAGDALRLTLPDRHRLRNGGLPIELRIGLI